MLPMLCVTLGFSQYAIHTTVEQQQERSMGTLSSNLSKVDGEIARVYMALLDLRENSYEIRDIALRYPDRISAFELGQQMSDILSRMTSLALTSDMVQDMAVHWLSINRAASLSRCYAETFNEFTQDYLARVQGAASDQLIEGPYGELTLFTLDKSPSGERRNFLLYAVIKKNELVGKLLPVEEGSLAIVLGDGWSIAGDGQTTLEKSTHGAAATLTAQQQVWEQMEQQLREKIGTQYSGAVQLGDYLCLFARSSQWNLTACNLVPRSSINRGTTVYQMLMCAVVLVTVLLLQVARTMLNRSINKPINALVRLFRETGKEQVAPAEDKPHDAELNLVYENFWQMRRELQQTQEQAVAQGVALEKAKYHLLLAQIDPHFLHNCFNVINTCLNSGDTDTAQELVGYLRQYFRGVTYSVNEVSALKEEWVSVNAYLNIQRIRFGHLLEVTVEKLPAECETAAVPRLALQSLVENIFKHAVNRETNVRRISLDAQLQGGVCLVRVWDNGDSLADEDIAALQQRLEKEEISAEHVGLSNIHSRLKWMHPENGLKLQRPPQGGFMVEVRMKVEETKR